MVLGVHSTWPSQIFSAPAVFLSIPGFLIIPGVCAVVSGETVPLTTCNCRPLIDVLINLLHIYRII